MIFLEKEKIVVVAHDYAITIEQNGSHTLFIISGEKGVGKEKLSDVELVRFAGACQCGGMGADGFQKEVIKALHIDPDRIRVLLEGSTTERIFVKLRPEEFFQLATLSLMHSYPKKGQFDIMSNSFVWSLGENTATFSVTENNKSMSIKLIRDQICVLSGAIQGALLGKLITPAILESLGPFGKSSLALVVDEFIEAKDDPQKILQDTWSDGQKVSFPLFRWVEEIRERARKLEKPSSGYLRAFLKKHSISYDRKIVFSVRDKQLRAQVSFRMPIHYAEGLRLLFMRWLYNGRC